MRKKQLLFILLCLLQLSACEAANPEPEPPRSVRLYYFHDTPCGSCDGAKEFYELFHEKISDDEDEYPYVIIPVNVFQSDGLDQLEKTADEYGISRENLEFPLLIINGNAFSGLESIANNLREAFLAVGQEII
ncbi:MAG: hypothetical protein LBU32_32530 [Clostridiales bacterium]|nr:hypothetical protein [Clostridiales bacterium]